MSKFEKEKWAKDKWDKIEIICKVLGSLLAGISIALIGFFSSNYLNDRQTKELRWRLHTELISNRENAESALRGDMFKSIIDTYMKPDTASTEKKLLDLELLTYNFHESICIKPLYMHLERVIESEAQTKEIDPTIVRHNQNRLFKAAREIKGKQLSALMAVGNSCDRIIQLENLEGKQDSCILELESIKRVFYIRATDINKEARKINVDVRVLRVEVEPEKTEPFSASFGIGPYDFPMIDNSRLSNDQRFAIVLNEFDETSAWVTLVYFPGSHASLKEKSFSQDIIDRLMEKEESNIPFYQDLVNLLKSEKEAEDKPIAVNSDTTASKQEEFMQLASSQN
ncbi:MAG: hypothetical protein GY839_17760 [candidate division Zixibacteria bacterium]|nr:hypothetical protein [candidate division Zixibacteria bacterium]